MVEHVNVLLTPGGAFLKRIGMEQFHLRIHTKANITRPRLMRNSQQRLEQTSPKAQNQIPKYKIGASFYPLQARSCYNRIEKSTGAFAHWFIVHWFIVH